MMPTLQQLQALKGGKFIQSSQANANIAHVIIDSRKLIFTEQALFIAIKGERNNAHQFLQEVYDAGVRNFIVEEGNYPRQAIAEFKDCNILEVKNALIALQNLAQIHRSHASLEVLAITGSNGKTIVKEWLTFLLKDAFKIVRSPKSYNSQIGVPLSVLQIQNDHELGIFEAGISLPNEMPALREIIQPNTGILTLLGDAHQEGFGSMAEKLREKSALFESCQQILYPHEQETVKHFFKEEFASNAHCVGWSRKDPNADIYIEENISETHCTLTCNGTRVQIPFTDEASIWNACTCLAYLSMRGLSIQKFAKKFEELPVLEMRLQLKEAHQNSLLINDSYSADLGSLAIAFEFMQQHAGALKRVAILSDFLESGKTETALYEAIARQCSAFKIDCFIGIGEAISRNAAHFHFKEKYFYPDTRSFISKHAITDFNHSIILLKGARHFAFEKIGKWLERKVHQTVFEINLNALVNNLNVYKALLKPKVKLMAMVKAFSYGAGSYEISRILSFNRVDYLTVAYADEGVVLRNAGIRTPIMVMNPEPHSFDAILKYHLEPEIYQFEILKSLIQTADGEEVGIHLELDSGMKRLGFEANQLSTLLQLLKENPNLKVRSVFTHLAASEDPAHDAFTQHQIDTFNVLSKTICDAFTYPILRHCLNSGGIARFPDAQFDMVRLGIGLYGVNPAPSNLPLQAIGTLKTVISQIREISAEESIGYGRKGHLAQSGKIAIVAIGYADGLSRKLSNGVGAMLVNGKLAPIVGNICMDMTMLDISRIQCKVGDEAIVFGQNPSILRLSEQIGTIPYEILTGVSQRVKRVYYYE